MNTDPLNEEELNFVDETLLKYGNDDSILNISELDGFLTAIVSGPEAIMPSQWIPVMWGGAGNEPEWETEDEFQRFFSLVMQHMNNNITMLMDYPEEFEALFMHGELDGRTYRITGDWCEGYLKGVQMSPDEWLKLPEPMLKEQLGIMGIFGSDEHIEELDKLSEAGVEALQDKIEPAACALHAYFLRQREKEIPKVAERKPAPISVLPKVGRNDPCPCGSGKKYKKCCLH